MNLKLSRNKVNYLANLISEFIKENEDIDFTEDIGTIKITTFRLINDALVKFKEIEKTAEDKIRSQKKNIPEGSREWDILFRKYTSEGLTKLPKIWD